MKKVYDFLSKFQTSTDMNDVFNGDCSYWFAVILFFRFIRDKAEIVYDEKINHFATKIEDRVYDISGDVTDNGIWIPWESTHFDNERDEISQKFIF